jgi:TPR repeat protein
MNGKYQTATLLMITVFALGNGMAQHDEVPILKPKAKLVTSATLLVMCDLDCNWKLDGETKGRIDAGGAAKAKVELGQHALVAVTDDGLDKVEKDIEIKSAGQTIFRVELQPVRNDRIQAQEDADPVYLRDHAAQRAKEGQQLYDQKHFEEAKPILKKACTGGELAACVTLGTVYDPYGGLIQDYDDLVMARSLYQKACDGGVMSGCTRLGMTYDFGNDTDYNKSGSLYQKACDGGDMWGCNNLAGSVESGHGEPKDRSRALVLYQKACRGGFDWACHNLSNMQYPPQ